MQEKKVVTVSFAITYGLIFGGISTAFSLILYFADVHYQRGAMQSIVEFVIIAACLMMGIIAFKKANGGFISLEDALKVGLGISVIGAVIGFVYYLFLSNVLDPDVLEKTLKYRAEMVRIKNPEISQETVDRISEMSRKFSSPLITGAIIVTSNLFFGFVISLIGGLIVKKSKVE